MKPHIKATIALPITVGMIALVIYLVSIYPVIIMAPLIIVSFIGILSSLWYGLYISFGGEE
tara:strand:- start:234 stop:416 length:183 start_codon:yes stop_codon:yes gene_type:complete